MPCRSGPDMGNPDWFKGVMFAGVKPVSNDALPGKPATTWEVMGNGNVRPPATGADCGHVGAAAANASISFVGAATAMLNP